MLQKISSVLVVYRRKTLTGSPDPTHANGTDKPCMKNDYICSMSDEQENDSLIEYFYIVSITIKLYRLRCS